MSIIYVMDKTYIVLIVDDEPDVVQLIKETLTLEKGVYNSFSADNGQLGYIKAKEIMPDIIILDVNMPRWDGYQTYLKLKSTMGTAHIPVIFLTASNKREDIDKALKLGIKHYLIKPFDPKDLLTKLKSILK